MNADANRPDRDSSVAIRVARIDDADAIAHLTTELGYPSSAEEIRDRLDVLLSRESYYIAVAEESSRVVGWVAAEGRVLLESGERAEIVGLVVATHARRAGIGRDLVDSAERWARGKGFESIFVRSSVARVEAHPFYESLGYLRAKTQHAYRKDLGTP
jgi:N-acetylglutamate synthase-like GNAT family acetyltransferase